MLTAPHAFVLGHTVPIIGIYFRALELLGSAKDGDFAQAAELLASLDARHAGTIANVRRAEALLGELPASAGDPPRTPADYDAWAKRILDAVEAGADRSLATVHLVGRQCGSALQTINLAVYELALLDANAGDAQITGMIAQEREELARLSRLLRAASLMVPAGGETAQFADELDNIELVSLADTQAAMKRCADRLPRIEAALQS